MGRAQKRVEEERGILAYPYPGPNVSRVMTHPRSLDQGKEAVKSSTGGYCRKLTGVWMEESIQVNIGARFALPSSFYRPKIMARKLDNFRVLEGKEIRRKILSIFGTIAMIEDYLPIKDLNTYTGNSLNRVSFFLSNS